MRVAGHPGFYSVGVPGARCLPGESERLHGSFGEAESACAYGRNWLMVRQETLQQERSGQTTTCNLQEDPVVGKAFIQVLPFNLQLTGRFQNFGTDDY